MTARDLMNTAVVTLTMSDTFGTAFQLLMERRIRSLPILDAEGVYKGMFDMHDIWKVLLPRAATLSMDALTDLSFVSGSVDQLREKLADALPRPISEFLDDEKAPSIPAESPVKEAMLLFYKGAGNLPVVDRKSHKLLGILSPWEVLATLKQ